MACDPELKVINEAHGERWTLYNGDSCQVLEGLPSSSVHLTVHSPPFSGLYIYSDSECDLGNSADHDEFFRHYDYVIEQLYRLTIPGRLCVVHCKDLPEYMTSHGAAGLYDFPGECIRRFTAAGWQYHSRVTIWKDPVTEMQRTKSYGLLHAQLCRDSCASRQGMPDYLLVFRKWDGLTPADFPEPVRGPAKDVRFRGYVGTEVPSEDLEPRDRSIMVWQRYASPVWFDIDQTDVLNGYREASGAEDERHICLARGSLVLTRERGHVRIEDLELGENVLTHKGRWRPIIAKEKTADLAKVVSVSCQGLRGLKVTPGHKLWFRRASGKRECRSTKPQWVEAQHCEGGFLNLKLPPIEADDTPAETWWIVGRWIADGHWNKGRETAHLSVGDGKLESTLNALGDRAGFCQKGTATQVLIRDPKRKIRRILKQCGKGAEGKRFPPKAFTLERDKALALLTGYLSGDGHYDKDRDRWSITTVSRELAIGLQFLVQRVFGQVATMHAGRAPGVRKILGRDCSMKQEWIVSFNVSGFTHAAMLDDGAWKPVKAIEDAGEAETWNIRVLEDESYTAEGVVVKNCPLQLGVIERCVHLWSNPGDVVLSPFAGIGSEGHVSLKLKRKFVGCELKPSYFRKAVKVLTAAEEAARVTQRSLFDEES